jgi:hypothetical protein
MNKTILTLIGALMIFSTEAYSQEREILRKWGIETDVVQPFVPEVGINRFQLTRTITSSESKQKGDLLLGAYIRANVKHDVVEKINEYMVMVGYRHYFWKGLNAEAKSNVGYAWGTRNLVDDKDYNNFSWFWEANAGYKFNFLKKQKLNLYVMPQFGIISKVMADIGPRNSKPDTFIQGNLMIGVNF